MWKIFFRCSILNNKKVVVGGKFKTSVWRILLVVPATVAGRGREPPSSRESLLPKLIYLDFGFPGQNAIFYY